MKLVFGFLLISLALSGVVSLPARSNPQDDAEVISPTRQLGESSGDPDFREFKGVIDTGAGYPFLQPHPSSFNLGFFDSFEDIFRRLRARLWPVIVDDGSEVSGGSADRDSSDDVGSAFAFGLRPLTSLNPKNGNTTSTVKVVDGHKVEINETVYGDTNSLFKVRVVNVRPLESGEEVAEGVINNQGSVGSPSTSAPTRADSGEENDDDRREPLEKEPKDNEVRDIDGPQSTTTNTNTTRTKIATSPPPDSIAESTDILPNITATMDQQQHLAASTQDATMQQHNEETEELDDSRYHNEPQEHQQPDSLTAIENFDNDEEEQDSHPAPLQQHKEREELEESEDEHECENCHDFEEMSETFKDEWSSLDQDSENDLDNHIDIYENFVPVDLSNDIAVNDAAAADPNFPQNPDAEFIEVGSGVMADMPKFEKLSLGQPQSAMPEMK